MISVRIFQKRFLSRSEHILWRYARGVDSQMPPDLRRYGRQVEVYRSVAGIEHQEKCMLLILMDQTGKLFLFRIGPIG